MANAIYDKFRQARMTADVNIDLENEDVRMILIDAADYTFSQVHDMLDDVPGAARVAVSGALAGKTVVDGAFDANDVTLTAVAGDQSEAIIFYRHTPGLDGAAAFDDPSRRQADRVQHLMRPGVCAARGHRGFAAYGRRDAAGGGAPQDLP